MILIDFNQLCISTLYAQLPAKEVEAFSEEHIPLLYTMVFNTLRSYRTKYKAEFGELVICTDYQSWRNEVFPLYKAHRKSDRKASRVDWSLIFGTLYQIQRDLKESFPYLVLNVHGAEADDCIAVLCNWFSENDFITDVFEGYKPQPSIIISGDKDFIQLQKYPNVKQYSPILKKWLRPKTSPAATLREHIIRGDKGDGVPNFKSPDNAIVDHIRQVPILSKNLQKYLTAKPEEFCSPQELMWYRRNERLIDLSFIPDVVCQNILKELFAFQSVGRRNILPFFIKHKMRFLIDKIGEF